MHVVVIADSPTTNVKPYMHLIQLADLVITADGAARWAKAARIRPDILIGDFDSLASDDLAYFTDQGCEIQRFLPHKDETDLELALLLAVERGATRMTLLGGFGGRPDMHFSHHMLLAHPAWSHVPISMYGQGWVTQYLRVGTYTIAGQPGLYVSLIPLCSSVIVSTSGLLYPLHNGELCFGPARGLSNEFIATEAEIEIHQGHLLLFYEDLNYQDM